MSAEDLLRSSTAQTAEMDVLHLARRQEWQLTADRQREEAEAFERCEEEARLDERADWK